MTVEEYNMKLRAFISGLEKFNRPFERAVQSTTQMIGNRIFVKGEKSDGSIIGQYDTKNPLYVNPDKVPSAKGLKPTRGKTGEHKFKNGKEHKTTYVQNYKDLRNRIGRRIDKVNLILSGDLQSDWRNAQRLSERATAIKVNANEYVITLKRDINQKKMDKFDDKYGTISKASGKERKNLQRVADNELKNDLKELGLL
jgi:hypothetical protein